MSIRSCGNPDTAGERSCCLGILLLFPFSLCVCQVGFIIVVIAIIDSYFVCHHQFVYHCILCVYIQLCKITCDEVGVHYIQIYDYTQMPVLLYPQICRHSITYYPVLEQCGSKTTGGKQFYCA